MTLALTMIVKNESDVLLRALSGAKGYADQIVIVDTGSNDGTAELARSVTAEVYGFEWRDDFSAARNFALSKVKTDYWMWLDADDIVPRSSARRIAKLKNTADGKTDMYMCPYVLGGNGRRGAAFSFYRERIVKNGAGHFWQGRVHEAVPLAGVTAKEDIRILHAKPADRAGGTRNLDIYRKAIAEGARLGARDRYYYARELLFNGFFREAEGELEVFLREPNALAANKIDACVLLARCRKQRGDIDGSLSAVFSGFAYGLPTGEACCEAGAIFFERGDYRSAAFWYECAAQSKPDSGIGAFVNADCYNFLPYVWLTVCYDRLGDRDRAFRMHRRAAKFRPDHPSVIANAEYFKSLGYE